MSFGICRKPLSETGLSIVNGLKLWPIKKRVGYSPPNVFGFNIVPSRTTFILKRKYPVRLAKKGSVSYTLLKPKNYVYELVEDTEVKPQGKVDIILKTYVKGIGQQGDVVNIKKSVAYNDLLLPGLADYVTSENLKYWSNVQKERVEEVQYSSPFVERTINILKNRNISVVMNKETKWTIEPWHIRVSFRKAGVYLNENCIELPANKIEGPNMDLEGKHFFVTVTINKQEKVKVKCIIHHWSTVIIDRLPYVENYWLLPQESIFLEDTKTPDITK